MISLATNNSNVNFTELAVGNGDEASCTIHCESQTVVSMPTVRLDEIIDQKIHYLKVDIDGEHDKVIQGSLNLLAHSSPLVMIEMSVNIMDSRDVADMISMIRCKGNASDVIALRTMTSIGYKLIAVRNGMNSFFVKSL